MSEVQAVNEGNNHRSSTSGKDDDTQLYTKYFFYTWTLNNFLECTNFSEPKILSPQFEFAGARWRLWLQSICKNNKLDKVNIRLMQSEKCDSGYYIKYKFSLLKADGSLVSKEAASLFGETHLGHRLSFKYREKDKNGSSFIVNDKVIVHCELLILASVASNDQLSFSLNQSNNPVQKRLNEAMNKTSKKVLLALSRNYPTRGLIQLQSSSRMPKTKNKPKSLARTTHMDDFSQRKTFDIFFLFAFSFVLLFLANSVFTDQNSIIVKLNTTEVNELIIDSTLKIHTIAEALNLSTVKIKSAELLEWYHDKYNISNAGSREKTLSNLFFDKPVLNDSSNKHETSVNVNSTDHSNDNEKLTEH